MTIGQFLTIKTIGDARIATVNITNLGQIEGQLNIEQFGTSSIESVTVNGEAVGNQEEQRLIGCRYALQLLPPIPLHLSPPPSFSVLFCRLPFQCSPRPIWG